MNKERILKYLSDLMDESEKRSFENDLQDDPELKTEFERVSSNLNDLKNLSDVEVDERYFTNLAVRIKTEKTRSSRKFKLPALVFTTAAAMLLAFFITSDLLQQNDSSLKLLAGYEDVIYEIFADTETDLTNDFDNFEIFASNDFLLDQVELNEEYTEILPDFNGSSSSDYFEYNQIDYQLQDLDQQEINILIQELNEKNIL